MNTPIRVIIVDDQALFRTAIAIQLKALPDIDVVGEAEDGSAAVAMADELRPDVVIMDIRMPDMDGVEATRRIVGNNPDVRVLILTTFDLDDRATTAIRHGAAGFLLKDASPAQLAEAIRTVHLGNAVLAPNDLSTLMEGSFRTREKLPEAFHGLTTKEREVLMIIAEGLSNAEIAMRIGASESTVKSHISALLRKLDLRDRVQLVVFAYEHGLLD
ncbi:two component transcriptional regulator, LuxR family [Bowdeniella nasicola]|uniref:Two component transcriptional regulator, LuxR family n=1 Tax=Bowdeniella nasicola TaxID=208480 RepID=A0A1H4D0H5_9ACTO|nr:response regulator transcription factor [Bowdeniella nasicola]SEA66224.1 two component transcriptional regulator, LuxR family [Bowdeniella nasicola]